MSRKFFVVAVVLLGALWGCQKEDTVTIRPRADYLDPDAGSSFVNITASGAWTLSVEFPGGTTPWADVDPTTGSGNCNDAKLRYQANPSAGVRQLTLVLTPAKGKAARATVTQAGKGEEGVAGNYGYDVAPMDWLELPATVADDGREVLVHDMQGGKYKSQVLSGVRNWSCYWDYEEHLSLWVAYPLNNSLKGSGSRSNEWGYDKLLPAALQPDIIQGSYGGGWTRGHQIPSADRLSPRAANVSTFVPTNMTPQDYDFNGEIWANLEGRVRNYAGMADTLYVVTGCLFDKSTRTSGNKTGFVVKIPTHYFKALLYKGSSSYAKATDGYMAAGFILPHDSGIANENFIDYRCTIDELEKQTGIDFFPNLEKRLGKEKAAAIEADCIKDFWK